MPCSSADAHRVERRERRRDSGRRSSCSTCFARLAEDERAAERGAVEQHARRRRRCGARARHARRAPAARGARAPTSRRMLGGTSSSTSPSLSAFAARSLLPARMMSSAARTPMSRGSRWQPAGTGDEAELDLRKPEHGLRDGRSRCASRRRARAPARRRGRRRGSRRRSASGTRRAG